MNSLMVVCLGLYSIGVGLPRPEDKKAVPAVEPAKNAAGKAGPLAPAGAPQPNPFGGFKPPAGFPIPINPAAMPMGGKMPAGFPMMPRMAGPPAGFNPMGGMPQGMQFPNANKVELPKDLIPTLIESLKDKDRDVRKYVASALARLGREAVEPLIELLKGKDKAQRANAAYVLGQIGGEAHEALPLLIKALKDDDKDLRLRAAFAVERLLAAPRNNMMGMGMMPMNPMTAMMGHQERKSTVSLPADPGPVGPAADNPKPVKDPEKKIEKAPEKKEEKGKS